MELKRLDAHKINTCLPGLGIPSHFAVMADPVSIGGQFSAHGELVAIAIGTCFANPIRCHRGPSRRIHVGTPVLPLQTSNSTWPW